MAGKIVADTLEHSTAGSVTTDYVVNGSAKVWVNFDQPDIAGEGIRDSLNMSSLTDNSTGNTTLTFSSSFSNNDFSATATGWHPSASFGFITNNNSTGYWTTSSLRTETIEHDGGHGHTEFNVYCASILGDLA
jgi:hypothetical protein